MESRGIDREPLPSELLESEEEVRGPTTIYCDDGDNLEDNLEIAPPGWPSGYLIRG